MSLDKSSEKKQRKLTPKQEKFCQNIVSGLNPAQAYKQAYNPPTANNNTIRVEAHDTLKSPNVSLRIEELRRKQEKELNYTTKDSFLNLELAQSQALEQGNIQAYLKAEELKGKLLGFYTEKRDIEVKGQQTIFVDKKLDE